MEKLRKMLLVSLICSVVLGVLLLEAWSDYTWHDRYLERSIEWAVFDIQRNMASPLAPWSFFKPPACRLGLIEIGSITKIEPGVYKYKVRWVDRDVGAFGGTNTEDFVSYIDTVNGLDGDLKEGIKTPKSRNDFDWRRPDDNPYAHSREDRERLVRQFQRQLSIIMDAERLELTR